jgi:capsular polysaccharide export protein
MRRADSMPTKPKVVFCAGFHMWKWSFVRAYLRRESERVVFVADPLEARLRGLGPDAPLVVWGRRARPEYEQLARRLGAPIWRMEDGFLRSVGLGSNYQVPASLVLDKTGIYFDATGPSDLERILGEARFDAAERERAELLGASMVSSAISKYNFPRDPSAPGLVAPAGRTVVLVPGQVESDASIRFGGLDVRTNLELLRAVRSARPNAHVIYKPHPDVIHGNGPGGELSTVEAQGLADEVVVDRTLPECLAAAHEVHTITSLVGFEALLRKKRVVTYGLPFYAGWGLTEDRHICARRTRTLALAELVAGTLIRYPTYLDLSTWRPSTPEQVVSVLRERLEHGSPRPLTRLARRLRRARLSACGLLRLDELARRS